MHKSLLVVIAIAALLVVAGCGNKETPKTSDTTEQNTPDTTTTTEIDDEEISSLDSSELDSLDQDLAVI